MITSGCNAKIELKLQTIVINQPALTIPVNNWYWASICFKRKACFMQLQLFY